MKIAGLKYRWKEKGLWVCLSKWILFCFVLPANGQQMPQYTQYIFNNYLLNPAISGIERYVDVKMGYRSQWQGLEGAPVTSFFSIQAPLGGSYRQDNITSFPEKGSDPMSRSRVLDYQASEPHHGVGMQAISDRTGPINRLDLTATYAYHLGLSARLNLALGVAAGLSRRAIDISALGPLEENDPAIQGIQPNQLSPNLGAGLWLYGPRFFIGTSALQLLSGEGSGGSSKISAVPHFYATGGYKVFLSDDIDVLPSILLSKTSAAPMSVDLNAKLAFRDAFWLGGSFRKNDSFSAIAGFNISHLFNLSYAYDFTTSELQGISNGSHEIVLGLLLNNRYRVTCPQRTW